MAKETELFEVGDVIRNGDGPTAMMVVETVHPGHGGAIARYYGRQFFGDDVGAYHGDCRAINQEDRREVLDRLKTSEMRASYKAMAEAIRLMDARKDAKRG